MSRMARGNNATPERVDWGSHTKKRKEKERGPVAMLQYRPSQKVNTRVSAENVASRIELPADGCRSFFPGVFFMRSRLRDALSNNNNVWHFARASVMHSFSFSAR